MAGNYADVPSWRMAYDVDGTQGFYWGVALAITQYSSAHLVTLNDESTSAVPSPGTDGTQVMCFIFPELRDLDAFYVAPSNPGNLDTPITVQVSTNTTNGFDGTWTTLISIPANQISSFNKERARNPSVGTALGIKGVKFSGSFSSFTTDSHPFQTVHMYGEPAPDENLQRLEIWHPTEDRRHDPAFFDWGDVPRNSTETREFRIKNMHPTLTANSVRAAMSILTDTTPSVVGQMAISKDGGASWGAQQTLTSPLGPEAISPVLQIRRQTPANATLSLWWYRLFAHCTSWT